jgi:predicted 3-demethylubiquinone-9 3-methyltransferase (glyoxalase superfamily)
MRPPNAVCLMFDREALSAARFYAATFPDSAVLAIHRAPGASPGAQEGDVLVVDFSVRGIPCLAVNGGPQFVHSQAFSFQIATDDQEETDRYWDAIVGNGGAEGQCGWCRDRWGVSWQITPKTLMEGIAAGGETAQRVFAAMLTMQRIDCATIDAARRG